MEGGVRYRRTQSSFLLFSYRTLVGFIFLYVRKNHGIDTFKCSRNRNLLATFGSEAPGSFRRLVEQSGDSRGVDRGRPRRERTIFSQFTSLLPLSPFTSLYLTLPPASFPLAMAYPQPRATSHPIHDLVRGSLPDRPNSEFSILRTRLQALRSAVPQTPEHSLYQAVAPIYDVLKSLDGKDWDRLMETGFGYRQRDESTTYAYSICQTLCMLCRDIRDGKWQDFVSPRESIN